MDGCHSSPTTLTILPSKFDHDAENEPPDVCVQDTRDTDVSFLNRILNNVF